jgi:hypothetical protein
MGVKRACLFFTIAVLGNFGDLDAEFFLPLIASTASVHTTAFATT